MTTEPFHGAVYGLPLIAFVFLTLIFILASRRPLLLLGRIVRGVARVVWFPIRAVLRLLRIVPRAARTPRSLGQISLSAWSALGRVFQSESVVEQALRAGDIGSAADGANALPAYNFDKEDGLLARRGVVFQWIDVKSAYVPVDSEFTEEIADIYHKEADRFFSRRVAIDADAEALYEDAEGAVIVEMFKSRDRRSFYLLNELRKVIDANVRKLALVFSAVLYLVLTTDLFLSNAIREWIASITGNSVSELSFDAAILLLGLFLMLWMYFSEYIHSQRNNSQQLKSFLTRYLGRLSDRYRNAVSHAGLVIVGDENDAKKLSLKAQRWHKIVLWISFRVFFIESFLRNILYQVRRNTGYYVVFIPLGFVFAALFVAMALTEMKGVDPIAQFFGTTALFKFGFLILCLAFTGFLLRSMSSFMDLDQLDWRGFDDFNVSAEMDRIVGKYAEEVGYWRNRVKGGDRS